METTKRQITESIIEHVGGSENVSNVWHCMTRLRFALVDHSLVNEEKLSELQNVLGVNHTQDQLQVVIGNDVDDYYQEALSILNLENDIETQKEQNRVKQSLVAWFMDVVSGVFGPIVPAIAGAGMLKGIMAGLAALKLIDNTSHTYIVTDMIASGVFTFLPFFTAVSAAKKFKTNEYLAAALAATIMFPTMIDAAKAGQISNFMFLNTLPVSVFNYSGSVIPVIFAVFALSHIYKLVDGIVPKSMKAVVTPFLALFVTGLLTLMVIGPAGIYIGKGLAWVVEALFNLSPILAGLIVGAIRPVAVLTGMHHAMTPIALENFATKGWDMLMPMMFVANISITGAAAATYFKKNISNNEKQIVLGSVISGILGITEPALFGVLTKNKKSFIACTIGSSIASAIIGIFGVKLYGFILSSVFSIPAYIGPHMLFAIIAWISAFVISFIISLYFIRQEN